MNIYYKDKWTKIINIYLKTKEYYILSENLNLDKSKSFLQPFNEIKNCFDHLIRAKSAMLGLFQPNSELEKNDYINKNFDKALGHIYRAFFDTADFYSLILTENISAIAKEYDSNIIIKALPDYYSKIKPDILSFRNNISELRNNKDVGNKNITEIVKNYSEYLDKIFYYYKHIINIIPTLKQLKIQNRNKQVIKYIITFFVGVLITCIAFLMNTSQIILVPNHKTNTNYRR